MIIKDFIKTINIVGKKTFLKIFSLTFFIMILEIMGVAIVVPFIEIILGKPDQFIKKYNFLELEVLNQTENFVTFAILTLIVFFMIKSLFSIFVNRSFVYTVYRTRTKVQKKILDNFIGQNLERHLNKNSSHMINIINNREVIPELIQSNCNPSNIFKHVNDLLDNPQKLENQVSKIQAILNKFKTTEPSSNLAALSLKKFL